jgi:hypothetical protein
MKNVILYGLAFFSCILLRSQSEEVKKEIEKIKASASGANTWGCVSVTGYLSENDKKGTPYGKGEFVIIPGKGYYSLYGSEECISNENTTVLIDHEAKNIGVLSRGVKEFSKTDKTTTGAEALKNLKSSDTCYLEKNAAPGVSRLVFINAASPMKKTCLEYDKDFKVTRLVYYYNESAEENYGAHRMEIKYTYKNTADLPDDFFSTKKYISGSGKKLAPKEKYKNYTINAI